MDVCNLTEERGSGPQEGGGMVGTAVREGRLSKLHS